MFKLIKGAYIPNITGIKEEYQVTGDSIYSNVSAENIITVFEGFLNKMNKDEKLFLFIEVPCSEGDELEINSPMKQTNILEHLHKDVYYLDGVNRDDLLDLLKSELGELLINDGLVCFGFGSMDTDIELGKYKYNEMIGFLNGKEPMFITEVFDDLNIPRVDEIVTAWDFISKDNPGESNKYELDGKDIYDLIDVLKKIGLYKAETREEK